MQNLFDDLIAANRPSGLIQGLSFALVAAVDDPLGIQRVQVLDTSKGGIHKTDWLFRALPFTQYSPPVPRVNDLVVIGYINGNPHQGCYLGVVVNNNNKPVGGNSDLTVFLGGAKITLDASGNLNALGLQQVRLECAKDIEATAAGKATLTAPMVLIKSSTQITIDSPQITVAASQIALNATSVKINGKDVAVVGGKDSRNDTIVDKGY